MATLSDAFVSDHHCRWYLSERLDKSWKRFSLSAWVHSGYGNRKPKPQRRKISHSPWQDYLLLSRIIYCGAATCQLLMGQIVRTFLCRWLTVAALRHIEITSNGSPHGGMHAKMRKVSPKLYPGGSYITTRLQNFVSVIVLIQNKQ